MRNLKCRLQDAVQVLLGKIRNFKGNMPRLLKTELICLSAVFSFWIFFMMLALVPILISGRLWLLKFHPMSLMVGGLFTEEMIFLSIMSAVTSIFLLPSLVAAHLRFFNVSSPSGVPKKQVGWLSILTWYKVQSLCIVLTIVLWCLLFALDAIVGVLISAVFSEWGKVGPLSEVLFGQSLTAGVFIGLTEILILRAVVGLFVVIVPYFWSESYLSRQYWFR